MIRYLLVLLSLVLPLVGCGDWGTDGPDHRDQVRLSYRYYYGQDCSWVGAVYMCGEAYSLSRPLAVSVTVNWNGDARVYYDGVGPFDFWERDYVFSFDGEVGEYYYQFNLDANYTLTVYDSGAEAIYADAFTGVEYHYFYDIW